MIYCHSAADYQYYGNGGRIKYLERPGSIFWKPAKKPICFRGRMDFTNLYGSVYCGASAGSYPFWHCDSQGTGS